MIGRQRPTPETRLQKVAPRVAAGDGPSAPKPPAGCEPMSKPLTRTARPR